MKRTSVQWVLAVVITLASAIYQRMTGPTYPVRGTVTVGGTEVKLRLTRSHGGDGDQPVRIVVPDGAVTGTVAWRRYPTSQAWTYVPMTRSGDALEAALPHQPPAGKLEYEVRLTKGGESVSFPPRAAITRFKGEVSPAILVPHVLAMFLAMLFSTLAGIRAAFDDRPLGRLTATTCALLFVGGFILGPLMQQAAFGELWTGVPYGWDLTDNKTLLAGIAWAAAGLRLLSGKPVRLWIAAAALATLVVFMIPHSTWGSEIKWEQPSAGAAG